MAVHLYERDASVQRVRRTSHTNDAWPHHLQCNNVGNLLELRNDKAICLGGEADHKKARARHITMG